jgi:hypothetical protein
LLVVSNRCLIRWRMRANKSHRLLLVTPAKNHSINAYRKRATTALPSAAQVLVGVPSGSGAASGALCMLMRRDKKLRRLNQRIGSNEVVG